MKADLNILERGYTIYSDIGMMFHVSYRRLVSAKKREYIQSEEGPASHHHCLHYGLSIARSIIVVLFVQPQSTVCIRSIRAAVQTKDKDNSFCVKLEDKYALYALTM